MKANIVCLLFLVSTILNAQSVSIRYARVLTPADHLSLRYEHWTNGAINLALGGFMERSRKNNLDLSAYGAELQAEYASSRQGYEESVFGYRLGIGGVWQIEHEPWIYKDWSVRQRSSFGLLGELTGEWFLTNNFTLRAFAQQRYLLNQAIGHYRFLMGLGLSYRLSSY